jgi:hypothetical protein
MPRPSRSLLLPRRRRRVLRRLLSPWRRPPLRPLVRSRARSFRCLAPRRPLSPIRRLRPPLPRVHRLDRWSPRLQQAPPLRCAHPLRWWSNRPLRPFSAKLSHPLPSRQPHRRLWLLKLLPLPQPRFPRRSPPPPRSRKRLILFRLRLFRWPKRRPLRPKRKLLPPLPSLHPPLRPRSRPRPAPKGTRTRHRPLLRCPRGA